MPKDIGLSCPLCLNVDDPAGMLAIEIPHARFPQSVPTGLCRLCVLAIMKSAVASDLIDPREVFGDVAASSPTDRAPDSDPASDPAVAAVVLQDQRPGEAAPVDRPEPEVPAGGEDRGAKEQGG